MGMDSAGGFDGAADVVLATGDHLAAQVNLLGKDGDGVSGFVHLGPQLEHLFADHDKVTLNAGGETGQFTVTGSVLLGGGQHAGFHVQVAGDWDG
jgi:hypothetical protein